MVPSDHVSLLRASPPATSGNEHHSCTECNQELDGALIQLDSMGNIADLLLQKELSAAFIEDVQVGMSRREPSRE